MTIESFVTAFRLCLDRMRLENQALLERRLKEECINAAFCAILREEFEHKLASYGEIHYDIEYDKLGYDPKNTNNCKLIRPDILIHRRGYPDANFLFIEAKKDYLSRRDKQKLLDALHPPFNYEFAVGLSYLPEKVFSRFCVLQHGVSRIEDIRWLRTF